MAYPQVGRPFGAVVWTCIYPQPCNQTHYCCHSQLARGEAKHRPLPRYLVRPLLGVPLGFMVAALLQFSRGMMRSQGLFQEGHLGLHLCWYCHHAPILWCHPHGDRQQNNSNCQSGQQTAFHFGQLDTVCHAWQVPQCVGWPSLELGSLKKYFIAPLENFSDPQANTTDYLFLRVVGNLTIFMSFNTGTEYELAVIVISKISDQNYILWRIHIWYPIFRWLLNYPESQK